MNDADHPNLRIGRRSWSGNRCAGWSCRKSRWSEARKRGHGCRTRACDLREGRLGRFADIILWEYPRAALNLVVGVCSNLSAVRKRNEWIVNVQRQAVRAFSSLGSDLLRWEGLSTG